MGILASPQFSDCALFSTNTRTSHRMNSSLYLVENLLIHLFLQNLATLAITSRATARHKPSQVDLPGSIASREKGAHLTARLVSNPGLLCGTGWAPRSQRQGCACLFRFQISAGRVRACLCAWGVPRLGPPRAITDLHVAQDGHLHSIG